MNRYRTVRQHGNLKLFHVKIGGYVHIDGVAHPTCITEGASNLFGQGIFQISPSGVWIVTTSGNIVTHSPKYVCLHIRGSDSRSFNTLSEAESCFRKRKASYK